MAEHSDSAVLLTRAANEMEAGIIVGALEEEGIKATIAGEAAAGFRVGVPSDVEIFVAAADLARAQEILEDAEEAEDAADDEDEDDGA